MKFKERIGLTLYRFIGVHLPESSSRIKIGKKFRGFCASLFLKKCGKEVNIEKGARFSKDCTIGSFSGIGVNARIGTVNIGDHVMMGPNCQIFTVNHKTSRTDIPMSTQGAEEERPVVIEDDVWIGASVIILPGVTIGRGCIIGAGSVVTKSTQPFAVYCGNPAELKKKRTNIFDKEEMK